MSNCFQCRHNGAQMCDGSCGECGDRCPGVEGLPVSDEPPASDTLGKDGEEIEE